MGMEGISKSQVSRLCGEIDDKINNFLNRPLGRVDTYRNQSTIAASVTTAR